MGKLSPNEIAAAVRRAPLFVALGRAELAELLRACPTRNVPAGTQVLSPSQRADAFYVILAGRVKVYKLSASGDEQILHLYGPGRAFGEAAMWAGGRYPAYAQTLSDAVLLAVGRAALKRLTAANPDLALAMLAGMSAKLREFTELIERLSLKDVPARLAGVLLDLPAKPGTNTVVLRQTKRQLAAQIAAVPETLSRALAKLKAAGLIEVDGPHITILDTDALTDLADG